MKTEKIETFAQFTQAIKHELVQIEQMDAHDVYDVINSQRLYRYGGIKYIPFNQLLREIAIARLLGIDFVDEISDSEAYEQYKEKQV